MDKFEHDGSAFSLEIGDYSFPFHVVLPLNLPTSFEHLHACIRYMAVAAIEIPWRLSKTTFRVLSVLNSLDLNDIAGASAPSMIHDSKTFWYDFCNNNSIVCELATQQCKFNLAFSVFRIKR